MEIANVSVWIWATFLGVVLGFLALDLGVFHRHAHEIKMREALVWSVVWIIVAIVFNAFLYFFWDWIQPNSAYSNTDAAIAFFAGYTVERALSIDNIFVFLVVFSYFRVPASYQHRVLFLGIIGALVFRGLFIALGAALISTFLWTMVVFGAFLIFTGIKMFVIHGKELDPENNPVIRWFRKVFPTTSEYHGARFFIRSNGVLMATPLFVALLAVELTDIVFAVDSIPAIFAITQDPFIVFTSNVFAILGLRALFFALAGLMQLFHYLSYGLAAILVFVGIKMLYQYAEKTLDWGLPHVPIWASLIVIVVILTVSIITSLLWPPKALNPNPGES
jgi:tellurite resistance protein TerC